MAIHYPHNPEEDENPIKREKLSDGGKWFLFAIVIMILDFFTSSDLEVPFWGALIISQIHFTRNQKTIK